MHMFPRRLAAAILGIFSAAAVFAQSYSVKVTLQDSETGDPVGFATVSIDLGKGDHKYALSDSEGKATIERVRPGKYSFKAEIMGYKTLEQEITVGKENLDLGVLKMETDREVLDAAQVSAVGNPIIIKKDTVEYNASSYKLSENDVLEDLLKKLPGVEIADDGSITANGETITKITIDGKTFFLDDPQLASKNIPAKIVEKVKVVKKKSEQAEFTGIDDGEDETIIDLSVQKGMMNGMFGNAMAGGGHDLPDGSNDLNDWRFQGSAMVGRFSESNNLSVILNGNNTNNRGFNDMASSMMSAMGGGGFGGGGRGFGRGGNGVTTSWMGGLNGNVDLFDDKMQLGGNYLYNGANTAVIENTYKETYLTDGTTNIYNTEGSSNRNTWGHRAGIRLEHKFSDNTSILFQPQISFGGGDYVQGTDFTTGRQGSDALINRGFTLNNGVNKNLSTNGFLLFRQRLGIPGRTISVNGFWNISRNNMEGYNQSLTQTQDSTDPSLMNDAIVNQRISQTSNSTTLGGRLVYTEPLGGNFYMEGSYDMRWSKSTSVKDTYDSPTNVYDFALSTMAYEASGETYNTAYSNDIVNRYLNQGIGLAFMYQADKIRAQLGMSANPTNTYNYTNGVTYEDKRVNWAPRAMLFYDFTDNSNIRLFYFGRSAQPSTSQLMPVLDNTNPLSLALGNPYLQPYFNHNVRSDMEYSNKQSYFTMRLHLEGGVVQNPITNAIWYDNNARQYSFPVNGDNSFTGNVRLVLNVPIAKSGFTVSNTINTRYSRSNSYVGAANLDMDGYFISDDEFDYETFHTDYPDLDASADFVNNVTRTLTFMDRLRASYRNDYVEVMLGGRTSLTKPWYTMETATANLTMSNQINGSFKWTVGSSGLEISTDADYNFYSGYTTTIDPQFIWNAQISQLIFKRQATIALKAYDILNQSNNFSVSDTSNYHQETYNSTLGRYIILSFTFRFGNFGKAGEQMRSRMGGPGGPPPGR